MLRSLKIFASQLERGKYKELRELSDEVPGIFDISALNDAINQAVIDRMKFADGLLAASEAMQAQARLGDEQAGRNAISRAYYCIHHVARAVVLWKFRFDPAGHYPAIEELTTFIGGSKPYQTKLPVDLREAKYLGQILRSIMEQRHHADYHIYGASLMSEPTVDFIKTSAETCRISRILFDSAVAFLKDEGVNVV